MKYCTQCGQPIDDNALFCTNCGNKVAPAEAPAPEAATPETVRENIVEPEPAPAPVYTEPAPVPVYTQQPQATYNQPVSKLHSPGKIIAGFILGISALALAALTVIFAFCSLIPYAGAAMMVYGIVFGLFAVGCGIAGMILCSKALVTDPDEKKAKLGKTFSLIGIIAGGAGIIFSIIFGAISIAKWF